MNEPTPALPLATSVRELLEQAAPPRGDRAASPLPIEPTPSGPTLGDRAPTAGPAPLGSAASGSPRPGGARPTVRGKFFFVGEHKLYLRGVTYGPFPPGPDGSEHGDPASAARDLAAMAANGINAVRTYTVPPRWLLDLAMEHGVWLLIGLPWEQHVTFLDDPRIRRRIVDAVRSGIRACRGHPAVLGYAVGNEIPAPICRWHGKRPIERFLRKLYRTAKAEDPQALVTYVNYPSTEYLCLDFFDFVGFNVYLESRDRLEAYLARLQNIAGDRPLVMAEVGLDSQRNGEDGQAETLEWQLRSTLAIGCAGTFVFAWSDNWHRGGHDILDWSFGLTDRAGTPKPALAAVRRAFEEGLAPRDPPLISVVVCTYNGAASLRECLDGVMRIDYPRFEVLVVDDGSTDGSAAIADGYSVTRISTPNGGLSAARNVGLRAARGSIVAYVDDDAYPDPQWLTYLALAFERSDHVGIAGPNLSPLESGFVADCVANSPGGPSHVLHTDVLAEHLPGCNMAFRREALLAIDGFDAQFRIAGDDVDLCWRLLENGGTLGFAAGALVWHHRRDTIRGYLKQQLNYGRAEAMLERAWPSRYNRLGHLRWAGHLYGRGHTRALRGSSRVAHGVWGSHLFQSIYTAGADSIFSLMLMPEWYLVTAAALGLLGLGLAWPPLLWTTLPITVFFIACPILQAWRSAREGRFNTAPRRGPMRFRHVATTTALHMLQPLVRLVGRLEGSLTPWRRHGVWRTGVPRRRVFSRWSETWRSPFEWIEDLERSLHRLRVPVRRGGSFDRWDLQASCGMFGMARLLTTVEEHGGGRQMFRVETRPRPPRLAVMLVTAFALVAIAAAVDHAWIAAVGLGCIAIGIAGRIGWECQRAVGSTERALREVPEEKVNDGA